MDNVEGLKPAAPGQGQAGQVQQQAPITSPVESQDSTGAGTGATQPQTPVEGQSANQEGMILGKFKSQEDLAKAYQELESHSKKVEMDRAELEKLFVSDVAPQQPPVQPAPEQGGNDTLQPVVDALTPILRDEMSRSLSPVIARFELKDMVDRYGDRFLVVAKQVAEAKRQNPTLSMEAAFKLADYDNLKRTATQEGVQNAAQTAEQKVKAQVESSRPSGSRPEAFEDAVKNPNVPLAEIYEALGPEYKAFTERTKSLRPHKRI